MEARKKRERKNKERNQEQIYPLRIYFLQLDLTPKFLSPRNSLSKYEHINGFIDEVMIQSLPISPISEYCCIWDQYFNLWDSGGTFQIQFITHTLCWAGKINSVERPRLFRIPSSFLVAPRILVHAESSKREVSSLGSTWKSWGIAYVIQFFPCLGKSLCGVSSK
jgi:hypothetical protein